MKVAIYSRFNRQFREEDKKRNGILANPAWWEKRIEIYEKTAYRSLMNQSNQDFEIWTVFNKAQAEKHAHIREFIHEIGRLPKVQTYIEQENPTTEFEPLEASLNQDILIFNLDSDDHLHEETVANLHQAQQDVHMEDGYIYDLNTERMARYHSKGAHPPFWGIRLRNHKTVKEAHQYMIDNNQDGHHYQKKGCKLPDGLYLYTVHGMNTTNDWSNKNTHKHVGSPVETDVLRHFGYG